MLVERIVEDYKAAMKAKEKERASTLSFLKSKVAPVGTAAAPSDEQVVSTIRKLIKENEEAAENYRKAAASASDPEAKAGYEAKAASNEADNAVLSQYLPKTLDEAETEAAIREIVSGLDDRSMKAMGTVMKALGDKYGAGVDKATASPIAKRVLQEG